MPPPYVRPPHNSWGRYYYYPQWGWYHTALVAGATLAFVATLPNDSGCEQLDIGLYTCDGVLYRPTTYQNTQVYEIVSAAPEETDPVVTSSTGSTSIDDDPYVLLQLTSPYQRGARVEALQNALNAIGFDVGTADGVFGRSTDAAIREFQEWYGLPVTGIVDAETANAIGWQLAVQITPELGYSQEEAGEEAPAAAE